MKKKIVRLIVRPAREGKENVIFEKKDFLLFNKIFMNNKKDILDFLKKDAMYAPRTIKEVEAIDEEGATIYKLNYNTSNNNLFI